jgi:hypothetical protein
MFIYNLLLDLNSFFNLNLISELDSAVKWQVHFQDPATPIMEGLIDLHHHIFFFFNRNSNFCLMVNGINFNLFSLVS